MSKWRWCPLTLLIVKPYAHRTVNQPRLVTCLWVSLHSFCSYCHLHTYMPSLFSNHIYFASVNKYCLKSINFFFFSPWIGIVAVRFESLISFYQCQAFFSMQVRYALWEPQFFFVMMSRSCRRSKFVTFGRNGDAVPLPKVTHFAKHAVHEKEKQPSSLWIQWNLEIAGDSCIFLRGVTDLFEHLIAWDVYLGVFLLWEKHITASRTKYFYSINDWNYSMEQNRKLQTTIRFLLIRTTISGAIFKTFAFCIKQVRSRAGPTSFAAIYIILTFRRIFLLLAEGRSLLRDIIKNEAQ